MTDVQRAGALGVFVVLGGFALINHAGRQDNPYTLVNEAPAGVAFLGALVAAAGALVVVAAVIAMALGRDTFKK